MDQKAAVFPVENHSGKSERSNTFHVTYDKPKTPFALKIISYLPPSFQQWLALKNAAPKAAKDGCDILGEASYDPYDYKELIEGKLWRVRYKNLGNVDLLKLLNNTPGCNILDPSVIQRAPVCECNKLKADQKIISELLEQAGGKRGEKSMIDAGMDSSQDMLVVKLNGADGKLLLFNPCKIRPALADWLKERGEVEWIVSGSGVHTNQLPGASKAFPSAKIICSQIADKKIASVGARRADYIYNNPSKLIEMNELLKDKGVSIHPIEGDVFQAACVLAHEHLLEVDIVYGHSDESRWAHTSTETLERENKASTSFGRLFYYGLIYKESSPHGYLPTYRYSLMDPSNAMAKMQLAPPSSDGSSCTKMAESLRKMLALDFVAVDMAHSQLEDSMPAAEFRKCIDTSWRWLDGRDLLCRTCET